MNPAMPRIPRVRRLQSLHRAITHTTTAPRTSFAAARCLSTTSQPQSKNTEWVRKKLWKGDAPGAADPYTQRPEAEETSNLPQEALERAAPRDKTPGPVRSSRLALPPRRAEAATEKEVNATDSSYVPATSMEGLEEIPALYEWWEQPGHWGEESSFKGFAAAEKITDRDVIEVYLRRALVESLALKEAGVAQWATAKWREGSRADMEAALALDIAAQDGVVSLKGDATAVAQSLTGEAESSETMEAITAEEAKEMSKSWDPSWKDIALNDETRFAIRKRLFQLTGNLVPDAKLGAARTVQDLLALAGKAPKAERLYDVLEDKGRLQSLSNVKVHSRKIGAIDKEVAVGRWKVIEEELKKRGLPVTGTEDLPKNKERDWLTEKA